MIRGRSRLGVSQVIRAGCRADHGRVSPVRGALTALLSQEDQLEFPERVTEVSSGGHDCGGVAGCGGVPGKERRERAA